MRRIDLSRNPESEIGAFIDLIEGSTVANRIGTDVAYEAAFLLANEYRFDTLLDIGSGRGEHAKVFRFLGKAVTTLDPYFEADIHADFLTTDLPQQYDVVWASHVLEHQRNIGMFVDRMIAACRPDGLICISVPPEVTPYFILAHPNQFTAGMLMYHLVMAGINCREARALTYGYNVSVVVRNRKHNLPPQSWAYEEEAIDLFPPELQRNGKQLFGPAKAIEWESRLSIPPHFNAHLA